MAQSAKFPCTNMHDAFSLCSPSAPGTGHSKLSVGADVSVCAVPLVL